MVLTVYISVIKLITLKQTINTINMNYTPYVLFKIKVNKILKNLLVILCQTTKSSLNRVSTCYNHAYSVQTNIHIRSKMTISCIHMYIQCSQLYYYATVILYINYLLKLNKGNQINFVLLIIRLQSTGLHKFINQRPWAVIPM